ncbi:MAG: DUF1015 family protein [Chitinivibrionales bacterium]|nr:DUF1015 family protein [Chitinivibrionales bacterium]
MNFPHAALHVPTILLPSERTDPSAWAVVACDQYTSQPDYWERVKAQVGDRPSTLKLILPEAFLGSDDTERTYRRIAENMRDYERDGVLAPQPPGFILVQRRTSRNATRRGLVVALDLEAYDFREGATTLIRASEGTVVERLPPRARIREQATVEVPHVMVLIDDPEQTVIEPLFDEALPTAYDFDLMAGAGHITGYHVREERLLRKVAINLERLSAPELFSLRYGVGDRPPLLYAIGDGNHSFATAKVVWEKIKEEAGPDVLHSHPARFALVEIVNVHDPGLVFEPIHRVVSRVEPGALLARMQQYYARNGSTCSHRTFATAAEAETVARAAASRAGHRIHFVTGDSHGVLFVDTPRSALPTGSLQSFFDWCEANGEPAAIDYIHGDEALGELATRPGCVGFYLPPLSKHDLFRTIILDGALPRKTFSMGEPDEKRFYLECRRIVP